MKTALLMVTCLFTGLAFAQDFDLPLDYKMETEADYKTYEPQVLEAIDWLHRTRLDVRPTYRAEVNVFVLAWLTGTPAMTVTLESKVITWMDEEQTDPNFLMIFMSGWVKAALETDGDFTDLDGQIAGVRAVMAYYQLSILYLKARH